MNNYGVTFIYPTRVTYEVQADTPEEALKIGKAMDDSGEEQGNVETDYDAIPVGIVDVNAKTVLQDAPTKYDLETAIRKIIYDAENTYCDQTTAVKRLLNIGLTKEIIEHYGNFLPETVNNA